MVDRPSTDIVTMNKMGSAPNRPQVKAENELKSKNSQTQLYEQNILNAIRTNNFFMQSTGGNSIAVSNSNKDSGSFVLSKTGFNSSMPKNSSIRLDGSHATKPLSFRNSQNSQ